jgi:hypothetical protein
MFGERPRGSPRRALPPTPRRSPEATRVDQPLLQDVAREHAITVRL